MKGEVTDRLAEWAIATKYDPLPAAVKDAATRTLLNFVGCTLGGCRHPAVETALAAVQPFAGPGQARLLGRRERVDLLNAALINCMGSAVHTFDDTHLKSISHPGGPVAAAITAIAEQRRLKGTDFLAALVVGVEVACRLASMLTVPPARSNVSLFMTGITGGIAAAVAAAKLLGLDSLGMKHAIGVAAAQAAGIRETHGTMASSFVPANASRAGLFSAFLAEKGFTSGTRGIEGTKGFANVFGVPANLNALIDGLGSDFELLLNLSKPYPCGVLIHPAIDACLEIVKSHQPRSLAIAAIDLSVHPVAVELTGRRDPASSLEAQVSIYHWVAATFVRGAAGIPEGSDQAVSDPEIVSLRQRITLKADHEMDAAATTVTVRLADGQTHTHHVPYCRGTERRPLTDGELRAKFLAQAEPVLGASKAASALTLCYEAPNLADVSEIAKICSLTRSDS
jgi:2-methylcitrate dehydratase PrpD